MALFPPPPPPIDSSGSTSRFFGREERQFFARPGREIIRGGPEGRREVRRTSLGSLMHTSDVDTQYSTRPPLPMPQICVLRPTPPPPSPRCHATPMQPQLPPISNAASAPLGTRRGLGSGSPPPAMELAYPEFSMRDVSDSKGKGRGGGDVWMVQLHIDNTVGCGPTPLNSRRRAGKHTRRVIVK